MLQIRAQFKISLPWFYRMSEEVHKIKTLMRVTILTYVHAQALAHARERGLKDLSGHAHVE